jgi:hypothetical protein
MCNQTGSDGSQTTAMVLALVLPFLHYISVQYLEKSIYSEGVKPSDLSLLEGTIQLLVSKSLLKKEGLLA